MRKAGVLALIAQNQQAFLKLAAGLGVQQVVVLAAVVVFPGRGVGVAGPFVVFAGGDAVADHLGHVARRHTHAGHGVVAAGRVVDPIFQVVFVAPFVVQPGRAVAFGLALGVVGAAGALPVLGPGQKLHRRQFAEVVHKALPVQPAAEAIPPHQHFVVVDGLIMFDGVPQSGVPSFCVDQRSHLSHRLAIWLANLARSLLAPPWLCWMTAISRLPMLTRRS